MIDSKALDILFREAHTHKNWNGRPVQDDELEKIYDLAKMGPTSANSSPMRILFVKSPEAKARLKPCLGPTNVEQTMSAPVTAIIAQDMAFYENLPFLFPHIDARAWFVGNESLIESTAFRNSSLQGAYLILAARAMGLDCGPMSGFDNAALDQEFFKGTTIKSNFLCNLGYGDPSKVYPRNPRLAYAEVCSII